MHDGVAVPTEAWHKSAKALHKADGESVNLANMTKKHYTAAMTLMKHTLHWAPGDDVLGN